MKLFELFDVRSSDRRENGDHNLHHSVNLAGEQRQAAKDQMAGIYWIVSGKKVAGPFADKQKAESFKANRPDRVPKTAVMQQF